MWLVDNLNFDYMPNMADPVFQPNPTTTTQQGGIVVMRLLSMDDSKRAQPGDLIPSPHYEPWRCDVEGSLWERPATKVEESRTWLGEDRGIFEDLWQAAARLVKGSPVNTEKGD